MGKGKGSGKGRPSSLTDKRKELIFRLAAKGKTDVQIADIIGVHPKTLAYWKGTYPDFLDALKAAKAEADDLVEASLFRRATGYYHPEEKLFFFKGKPVRVEVMKHTAPDVAAQIFWLKNRNPKRWRDTKIVEGGGIHVPGAAGSKVKTFAEFCTDAGYPPPFEKQVEMYEFGLGEQGARLLLGARGYGKTDYVVILGLAYKLYLDPKFTSLIVTKSDERNAAMLSEIAKAASSNGVQLEKESATAIRVAGLLGKDHSVSAVTIGTQSLRGRHPQIVVMDDPVTEEDVSEATRKKVQRVYNEITKLTSNVLIIGQPVHKFDLYETLRPLLKKLEVPHGSIPELDHDLELLRLAGVSEESIQASYFLKVISEGGFPFDGIQRIANFLPCQSSVAFIDPSFTGQDYTALSIFKGHFDGVAVQGHCYKRAWNHCLDDMVKRLVACNVKRIGFECNALGDQPILMLREALKGYGVGVVGKVSTTHKHSRIMAAGPYASKIFLADSSDREYKNQVTKYEYKSEPDDAPDSLATGLEWLGLIRGKQRQQ